LRALARILTSAAVRMIAEKSIEVRTYAEWIESVKLEGTS
jgi:hypothetical protein